MGKLYLNTAVATITSDGSTATVKGVTAGTTTIRHTYGNKFSSDTTEEFTVLVVTATNADSISIELENSSIQVGTTTTATATVDPENATYTWSSSDTNVATVSSDGTVTGVGIGTAVIHATTVNGLAAEAEIEVTRNTANDLKQTAYFYIWKPGTAEDTDYKEAWYYVGTGTVTAPAATASKKKYYDISMVTTYPSSYPIITVDGVGYTYDSKGTGAAYTYTVNWQYLVDSSGANNGSTIIYNGPVYHVDGYAVLNIPEQVTVDFRIKDPGADGFVSVNGYPVIEDEGDDITPPSQDATKTVNGVTYYFDGWYTDSACTNKAVDSDFKDIEGPSLVFYAKYVADFTFTATGYEGVYDGQSHNVTVEGVPSGATVTYIVDGEETSTVPTIIDVGEKEVTVKVTFEGVVKIADVKLKVTPKAVTITAASGNKTYDGTALVVDSYTTTGVISGDTITSVIVSGSQLEPGGSDNVVSNAVIRRGETDVTGNYEITYVKGTLQVTKRSLTITADSDSKTYDGTALTNNGYTVDGVLAAGGEITVVVSGSQTDVGTAANTVTSVVIKHGETDVTDCYEITKADGKLEVTKKALTITAASASKEYDGVALIANRYTADGVTEGDTITSVTVSGSQLVPGSSANVASDAVIKRGETEVTGNYEITYEAGTLEVTNNNPIAITVTAASDSKPYDGTALTNGNYTVNGTLATGDILTATVSGSQTDAGSSDNTVVSVVIKHGNIDVTEYYKITTEAGKLEVTKKALIITAVSDTKKYDGTPLTANRYTATEVAEGDEITSVTVSGSQTLAGSSDNTASNAVIKRGEADVTGNYEITYKTGTLTVTNSEKMPLTVTAGSAAKIYDGTELTKNEYSLGGTLAEGDEITVMVSGSQTDVGTSANKVTSVVIMHGDTDVTEYYEITTATGELKVTKKALTITAASASKQYDGTELTKDDYTAAETAEGDAIASVTVNGSQLLVGSSYNIAGNAVIKRGEKDVTGNYEITYVKGTLEVTNDNPIAITVTAASDSKTYDGTALENDGYSMTGTLAEGDEITVVVSGSQTDVGEGANKVTSVVIKHGETDVTGYYGITTVEGKLVVTKKALTITAASDSKQYDGIPLTANNYTATDIAGGDNIVSVTVTGSQLLVGSSDNIASNAVIKRGEINVTENYEIAYVNGTLEVTNNNPIAITVTAASDSKTYDGTALMKDDYSMTGTLAAGDQITVIVSGSQTNAGTSENKVTSVKIMHGEFDVTDYYDVTRVDGKLVVNPTMLTIVTASGSKVYDAVPLTAGGEIEGFITGETATFTVTGSQLLVGESTNTYVLVWDGSAIESNYTISEKLGTLSVSDGNTDDPVDPKNVLKKTHDGKEYGLNSTVVFDIEIKNIYDEVKTITVTELPGVVITGDSVFENVQPGATVKTTAEYVITEKDLLAGDFTNTVKVEFSDGGEFENQDEVDTEKLNGHLLVTKETTSTPKNGTAYALNETITYKITVKNDGNLTITDITVTDDLTGDEWTIASLVPGESKEFDAQYKVLEKDVLAGEVVNVAAARGTSPDPENPDVPTDPGRKDDPVTTPAPSLFVEKIADKKSGNELGDTITYTIKVVNNGNVTVSGIDVEDKMTGMSEAIASLAPGESKEFTTTYKTAEKDILKGEIVNVATAKGTDPNQNPVSGSDDETVGTAVKNGRLTITKETTSTPENGTGYALGEKINYKITVTNDGNLTITNIVVKDELTEDSWSVASLAPGESKSFTTSHRVTEEEILAGEAVNVATGTGISPDPNKPDVPVEPGKVTDPTAAKNGHLTIEKETVSVPENGETYALGETIEYRITVTNDGNLTITDTTVEDELTGDKWLVSSIEPGESREFTAEYVVTEEDILAGSVVNEATAKGTSPDPEKPDVPVVPGEEEDPTEPTNGHLTIEKVTTSTPSNAEKYALGEKITYKITATNDGNLTLTDVAVTDELTGDEWNIDTLAPGESKDFTAEYVVTEKDILAGQVVNEATAKGDSPDPEKPNVPVDPGKEEDKTEDKNGHLTITKVTTSSSSNAEKYALGETITYKITATNDGNLTLTDVVVTDELTNDEWKIDALLPGESKEFTTEYTVVEEDIHRGYVVNEATAKGDSPDPEKPDVPVDPGKEEDKVDDPKEELAVKKEITNEGFIEGTTEFSIGDTIYYKITVTNTGNVTLTDIPVEDVTTGKNIVEIKKDGILGTNLFADYTVDGTTAVIKELKPSEEIEIICTYVVVRDDNGSTILNTAIAGKDDTRTEDDVPAKVEQTYDINIKHEFADVQSDTSVKLPQDYSVQNKLPGYNEKFVAGAVKGYAASPAIFDVTIVDRDITIIFIYYKDTIGTDPTNPSKPDQIPDYYQITFTFVSEDTAKGTVTDVTREVHNLYEIHLDENGRVVEVDLSQVKPVSPNAKVTVTPANKYKFTKWTSDNARVQEAIAMAAEAVGDNFNTTEEIREAAFITDTVFIAHFAKKSSGGGGGGSTPGGGSTTTIGGPGVPTASLPEVPVLEVQEEEVPLAALPKTGRTNANALVMLLSSVMLAAFAVTGKKKEEEN